MVWWVPAENIMAKWLSPGGERIRTTITRILWFLWLVAAGVAWLLLRDQLYLNDGSGSLDKMRVGIAVGAFLAVLWGTAALVRTLVGLAYGWQYTEMDQQRYDQGVIADVTRKDTIDRNLRR